MKLSTRPTTWLVLGLALLFTLMVFHAPSFLVVTQAPVKSDAVVLFLGGEKGTREKEAQQLVREGYAECLIIPEYGQAQKLNSDGKLERLDLKLPLSALNQRTKKLTINRSRLFEATHEEAIIAREMMECLGISSAILVSSPYHMRRIKMISGKVFKGDIAIRYVPTRYETPSEGFWLFNSYVRKLVLTEYAKIAWFITYIGFVADPG